MPPAKPKTKKIQENLPLHPIYTAENIRTPGGIEAASDRLARRSESTDHLESEIRGLLVDPDVLSLMLAANSNICLRLESLTYAEFPRDSESYSTSFLAELLMGLNSFFCSLASPEYVDPSLHQEHGTSVPRVHHALHVIDALNFEDQENQTLALRSTKHSQRQMKQIQRRTTHPQKSQPDPVFDLLKVSVPRSQEESAELCSDLLLLQYASLLYYLSTLKSQGLTSWIRTVVLRVALLHEEPEVDDPYPSVTPEKAKHVFDSPDGFGEWFLFISTTALKHLREIRRADQNMFGIVQKKIKELSHGFFSDSNQKRLGGGKNIPIFEAKMTSDSRLVYQIDLQVDPDLQFDRQVIRLHGVYTHAQFDHRLWSRVAQTLPKNDREYRHRCNYRVEPRVRGFGVENVTPPMIWPHQDYTMTLAPPPVHTFTEDEYLELHKILSLEKFIPYSAAVLRAIMDDIETTHAFAVSPTETRIINHPSSCFVIGRSGTGKTTTMLFKLLGIEQATHYPNQVAHSSEYRQVFLTQSHVLAQRVQEYYERLAHAAELSYGTRHESGYARPVEQDLLQLDEEVDDRFDLPKCFSNLTGKHFPLFVTFDQIRRMLENDLNLSFSKHRTALRRQATRKMITEGGDLSTFGFNDDAEATASMEAGFVLRDNYVTFESFHSHYWPHIDQRLTKGLDPSLVYSEIMGVISGHEDTIKTEDGYLDRASYVSLSPRAHSQFSTERDRVYDIFEKYRKMKHGNGEYDSPDRTHAILRKLHQGISAKIDFLYVDEVQDLLTVDTKLLRELCPNPHGLFWGGDTAQTISVGSSFRFEDLKALTWREERNNPLVKEGVRAAVRSEVFELLLNYRSHGGIVDCAASLISLISSLFPYSIDKLQTERAVVSGPKPRIFRSDLVHFEEFLCDIGDTRLDFGARQVIIVRNDSAREQLQRQLGDAGLILTLIESKGLEFDDVLLHDFFKSSPATAAQWRVVATKACDPIKHRVIESELKRLYVALTRARHHCWIWDSSELAQPMVNFWVSQNLVQIQDPSEPIPQLATHSTQEEWNTTGQNLFAKKIYGQAASCFAKANRDHDRRIAEAYQIRKEARANSDILGFKEAGMAFNACGSTAQGETAQRLYTKAAECFLQAWETGLAADNYKAASQFTKAVQLYRQLGRFDDVVLLLRPPDRSASLVDAGVADVIMDVVRVQFLRTNHIARAMRLFDSTDELLEFIDCWGFDSARKSVLKKLGKFSLAAELHLRDGEIREATECFAKSADPGDQQRASSVLRELWTQTFNNDFTAEALSLYEILEAIPPESLSDDARAEAAVFKAIAHPDLRHLVDLSRKYISSNALLATLCLNQVLRTPLHLQTSSLAGISVKLPLVEMYSQLIWGLLRHSDVCSVAGAQKLLGFTPAIDPSSSKPLPNHYAVASKSSYLASLIQRGTRTKHEGIISGWELEVIVKSDLEDCVRRLLEEVHSTLIHAPVLRPCMNMILYDNCNRDQCSGDHSTVISMDTVRMRARIHMQVILALDPLWAVRYPTNKWIDRRSIQRIWIERFYSSLYPLVHHIGNASESLVLSCPESKRAIPLMQAWIQEHVTRLRPFRYPAFNLRFLANTLALTTLASLLHQSVPQYFASAFGLYEHHPLLNCNRENEEYSIVEDLLASFDCNAKSRLYQGAFFIEHVVENRLPMDINAFVHFLEYLALAIILNHRQNWRQPFDNLTMPRSWILTALRGPRQPESVRNLDFRRLLGPVQVLLSILYSRDGSDKFSLDGHLLGPSYIPRAVIIARICRLLILIGENGPRGVREMILSTIRQSLGTANPHHKMYSGYVSARGWSGASRAMRDSMVPPTQIDYMVFLQHKSRPIYRPTPNVRHLVFTDEADIKRALEYSTVQPTDGPTTARQAPDATAEIPLAMQDTSTTVSEIPSNEKGANETEVIPEEATNEEWRPEDHTNEDGPPEDNAREDWDPEDTAKEEFEVSDQQEEEGVILDLKKTERPPTKEEHSAARLIQLWCQRCMKRNKARLVKGRLVRQWGECVAGVSKIKLVDDTVRLSYWVKVVRGPLPHVLYVVDTLLDVVRKIKATAKGRLLKAGHLDLEEIRDILNITTKVYRELLAGQKMISPEHEIFQTGDLMGLRKGVQGVERLLLECKTFAEPGDIDGLEAHMKCGIKGIIRENRVKRTAKKKGKPTLNTEDLDSWD